MNARTFALWAALFAAIAVTLPVQAAEKMSIGIIGAPGASSWLYHIAQAEGFFADAGIDPDFVYVPSAPGLMQQLVAGSLDVVGVDGTVETIHADAAGAKVAILRNISGKTAYELLAKASIKSVKDLKGKKICIGGSKDINRVYLERVMTANGIEDGQYDLIIVPNTAERLAALKSGAVDATMLLPPESFMAEQAGFRNIAWIKDYAGDLPFASADATDAWIDSHRDTAKKLIHVLDQSIAWFYDERNRDEAINILVKVSHADRTLVAQSYDVIDKIGMFPKGNAVSHAGLQHLIDAMKSIRDLQGVTITPSQLVNAELTELAP
ncbi:MAG TPA: ABC transporter substrate-binding protein [Xanthobacteraceae bacterium]